MKDNLLTRTNCWPKKCPLLWVDIDLCKENLFASLVCCLKNALLAIIMNCGDGEKGSPSGPPRTVSVAGILFCVGTKGYSVQCRRWLTSGCVLESATIVSILNNCKRKRVACVQVLGGFSLVLEIATSTKKFQF